MQHLGGVRPYFDFFPSIPPTSKGTWTQLGFRPSRGGLLEVLQWDLGAGVSLVCSLATGAASGQDRPSPKASKHKIPRASMKTHGEMGL